MLEPRGQWCFCAGEETTDAEEIAARSLFEQFSAIAARSEWVTPQTDPEQYARIAAAMDGAHMALATLEGGQLHMLGGTITHFEAVRPYPPDSNGYLLDRSGENEHGLPVFHVHVKTFYDERLAELRKTLERAEQAYGTDGTDGSRLPVPRPETWAPGHLPVLSYKLTQAAWHATQGEAWSFPASDLPYYEDPDSPYRFAFMAPGLADATAPDAIASAQRAVASLNDQKANTFLIALGKWLAETGGDRREAARIHVAQVLDFRGVKKHPKGGYRREQKLETRSDLLALRNLWVTGEETVWERDNRGRRRSRRVRVQSPLLEISIESDRDVWGEETPYAFRVRPGDWVDQLVTDETRWVATLLRPIMGYHPTRERLAMRIGIYLTFQWRIRAAYANWEQPWRLQTLLDAARIALPDRDRSRFREQVEGALTRLHTDGVVSTCERLDPLPDDAAPKAWWSSWLRSRWRLMPPDEVLQTMPTLRHRTAS